MTATTAPRGARVPLPYLKEWRTRAMLTQTELAAKAGVTQFTMSHIEARGKPANRVTVEALARALGITPQQLAFTRPGDVA